jgi:UDP-2-acetamido-3-amino-2,3-dideoxy-glucuronate N-acetyltransferase
VSDVRDGHPPRIHPTALIEDGVRIGPRTQVWNGVHVRGPARIGHDCIIGEKTYIAYGVEIGNFVKINAMVYIPTGITIEDRVMIAAGAIFTNDRYPRAFDDRVEGLATSGPTEDIVGSRVAEGATVGAGARIGPGVSIGSYAMVGMGAVVTADVPAHALVVGNPARIRGWVCICGRPLPSHAPDALLPCGNCGRRYGWSDGADGPMVHCRD